MMCKTLPWPSKLMEGRQRTGKNAPTRPLDSQPGQFPCAKNRWWRAWHIARLGPS